MRLHPDIEQSSLTVSRGSRGHERMYAPVLGVVMAVYYSDHPDNSDAEYETTQRASRAEATVLVVDDGRMDSQYLMHHVVICSPVPTGMDDYHERLPRPAFHTIDGSEWDSVGRGVDLTKLDGDWCVVQFIGGSSYRPIMTHWFPHPSNRTDPATGGSEYVKSPVGPSGVRFLDQSQRVIDRLNGIKWTISGSGDYRLDMRQAGSEAQFLLNRWQRVEYEDGGKCEVIGKPGQLVEVNFNPPVEDPVGAPDMAEVNPASPYPPVAALPRQDTATRLSLSENDVEAIAGAVLKLFSRGDSVLLGGEPGDEPTEPAVLGNLLLSALQSMVKTEVDARLAKYNVHKHPGSGLPPDPGDLVDPMPDFPDNWQSAVVKVK